MGMNTVVVILNDHLNDIRLDTQFGYRLDAAINAWPNDVHSSADGFRIVSMAHADYEQLVSVQGNRGQSLGRAEAAAVKRARKRKAKNDATP